MRRRRGNIDAWTREIDGDGLDAIVVNTSGCGTTVKDYGFMFRDDPAYADEGRAGRRRWPRDITEFLADARPRRRRRRRRPAPSPTTPPARCSTASRSRDAPKALLRAGGLQGARRAGGPSLLRLGRHLQHPAARDRRPAARPQGREHRAHRARRDRHRQYRLHHADRAPARRSRSSTPSSC